ncbi:MAG: hypothetical protein ACUVQG_10120 [Thermogutta sp.]
MAFRFRLGWPLILLLALSAAGAVGTVLPTSREKMSESRPQASPWRRTKDGWEIAWWLHPPKTFHKPKFHPLIFSACQLMAVISLLLLGPHWVSARHKGQAETTKNHSDKHALSQPRIEPIIRMDKS